ncbi:unnamed protein product [Rotaria sp. Silwood1]|nr:unnamed protein product [Rotaria sp. Silwood1]CAF4653084.1 unnamed protein product [Rotaria sp. Silwood1]CAF4974780.1 unnamed protein product [Rotaria sp. Silwood1]
MVLWTFIQVQLLMHIGTKYEYLTQQDKNDRRYSTLPMIIKVLSVLSNNEWEEYFPELSEYTLTLAKLLVYEIHLCVDKEI